MAKFNRSGVRPAVSSPVRTEATPTARTFEGAAGYARDAKSELFLLAVSNMVGEDTFYETGKERDDRYTSLVRRLAVEDPAWIAGLLRWLRTEANMRSAAIVGAAEYVKARLDAEVSADAQVSNRAAVASVLLRADEPGEFLAYWTSKYGRRIPQPVKRGISDAVRRLYNERSLLKYDSGASAGSGVFRFGDVLELTHPAPDAGKPWQGDLFKHAIDRRHGRDNPIPEALGMLRARADLMALPVADRRSVLKGTGGPDRLRTAGITWEALAGWLQGPMDAAAWSAVIPSMGYFALLRNLRNFDQAGVPDEVAEQVAARLADPEQVANSRLFPFRFWAAYKHAPSLRWAYALEKALNRSLSNVPALPGRTLVLVDRSPSMFPGFYYSTQNRSDIPLAEQAAVFGVALARRAVDATLIQFGGTSRPITVPKGGSILKIMERFGRFDGTDIPSAVKAHYDGHDRVIVVTDEQTRPGWLPSNMQGYGGMAEARIDHLIPRNVPVYMWNMAGYKAGAAPSGSGNRHTFGGLTDQAFRLIPLLESDRDGTWPWE